MEYFMGNMPNTELIYEHIADRITDILFSVQNEKGTSHLFDENLCEDVVKEIMKVIKAFKLKEEQYE